MYKVVNFQTGELLAKEEHISFVKQQVNIDFPIGCETLEEADGIVIYIDGVERTLGIEGRNMQNYTPTVIVSLIPETELQISIMGGALEDVVNQVSSINTKVNALYDAQAGNTIATSTLDEAYKEGVNSYAE